MTGPEHYLTAKEASSFLSRIRRLRVKENLGHYELSERLGISGSTLSRWKSDQKILVRKCDQVCKKLEWVFEEVTQRTSPNNFPRLSDLRTKARKIVRSDSPAAAEVIIQASSLLFSFSLLKNIKPILSFSEEPPWSANVRTGNSVNGYKVVILSLDKRKINYDLCFYEGNNKQWAGGGHLSEFGFRVCKEFLESKPANRQSGFFQALGEDKQIERFFNNY